MKIKITRSLKQDLKHKNAYENIFSDKEFLDEVAKVAKQDNISFDEAKSKCKSYLKEIAADATKNKYFWSIAEMFVRKKIIESFDNVYVEGNIGELNDLAKKNIINLLPNHRSVFDFMILSYILVKKTTFMPIILAGDVFNKFLMGYYFRKLGTYYVRRNEKNELYFLTFKYYVMLIVKFEMFHLFFIEGGRNKTGSYSKPKAGILKYIVDGKKKHNIGKNILFLPISLSYDFVPESKVVIAESKSGKNKHIISSISSYLTKKGLGNCYINFGKPIDISESFDDKDERNSINILANKIIEDIKSSVIVSPTSLLCYTLLQMKKDKVRIDDLKSEFKKNYEILKKSSRNIKYIDPTKVEDYATFAQSKGIIDSDKNQISISKNQAQILEYYSNNILHFF